MSTVLKIEHSANSIEVKIEEFTIRSYHILDFEMTYSIESVVPFGYILIADAINMSAQSFQDGDKKLTITVKDVNKKTYKAEFKIINGYQVRLDSKNPAIKLELMEEQSLKLSNLFWGKGYKQSTIQNVLTEIITKIKGDKTLDFTAPTPLQNFAIPANKPFTQTIEYFRQKYKLYIFRTKKKFICKDMNTILGSGIGPYKLGNGGYVIQPGNDFYYNGIKDISIQNTNRRKINNALPVSKTHILDYLKKEIKLFDYSFEKAKGEIATPGGGSGVAKIPPGDFEKVLVRDSYTEKTTKAYHFNIMQDLNSVQIVVSSNVDLEVGQIVEMEITPGGYFNKKEPEKFYKGKWLIHTLTEKLMGMNPIQKLTLIKPKM